MWAVQRQAFFGPLAIVCWTLAGSWVCNVWLINSLSLPLHSTLPPNLTTTYLPIHPPTQCIIHLLAHLPIHPSTHLVNQLTQPHAFNTYHPFIHPPHLSTHSPTYLSTHHHPPTHLSTHHPPTCLPVHLAQPLTHLPTPVIHTLTHLSSIHLPTHPFIYPPTHASNSIILLLTHSPIQPSPNYRSIHPSSHLSTPPSSYPPCLFIHPPTYFLSTYPSIIHLPSIPQLIGPLASIHPPTDLHPLITHLPACPPMPTWPTSGPWVCWAPRR